jgi:hypothetical protein
MVFSIPMNTFIARYLKKMQETQMKNRDQRTRLMSELLANIKRFAWSLLEHVLLLSEVLQHQALCMGKCLHSQDSVCEE